MRRGRPTRSSKRGAASSGGGVSDVHQEMIDEANATSQVTDRPQKRRRVGDSAAKTSAPVDATVKPNEVQQPHITTDESVDEDDANHVPSEEHNSRDEAESESGEYSDDDPDNVDWVKEFGDDNGKSEDGNSKQLPTDTISLDLNEQQPPPEKRRATPRIRPKYERLLRLETHKTHLCTLLVHVHVRNAHCNNPSVQLALQKVLNVRVVEFLNPTKKLSQFDRGSRFFAGLKDASNIWRGKFKVRGVGMRSSSWAQSREALETRFENAEPPVSKADLVKAAQTMTGSRDTGAQLFCALLRAVGVDARLVCSLQTLPLTSQFLLSALNTPLKPAVRPSSYAHHSPQAFIDLDDSEAELKSGPVRVKRFGAQSKGKKDLGQAPRAPKQKDVRTSASRFPVFWVEAFDHAKQRWIPVDPIATRTIDKPKSFEPPANDPLNKMTYVVAFEQDGSARDVTRRYAKAYNAKTRKARVESTDGGEKWLRKALKLFRSPPQDRDAIEDAELTRREEMEPMPQNKEDFRGHPHYALELHLGRREIIHPRREVGKLLVSKRTDAVVPIFRRRDVLQVKSARTWYHLGRDLQPGAQPLKLVKKLHRVHRSLSDDEDDSGETTGLFSLSQTDPYIPPPVIKGQIPKNEYKNLDIFTSSMIPAGAVWIRASDGVVAARVLGIDFAEAVTRFEYKGRQSTAIKRGVIIAREHREAMEEVVGALQYQNERTKSDKKSREALRMWKRFWSGVKIQERLVAVHGAVGDGSASEFEDHSASEAEDDNLQKEIDDAEKLEEETNAAGGFVLDKNQESIAQPTGESSYAADESMEVNLDDPLESKGWYFEPTVTSPWDYPSYFSKHAGKSTAANLEPSGELEPDLERELFGGEEHEAGPSLHHKDKSGDVQAEVVPDQDGGGFVPEDSEGGFVREAPDAPQQPPTTEEEPGSGSRKRKHAELDDASEEQAAAVQPEEKPESGSRKRKHTVLDDASDGPTAAVQSEADAEPEAPTAVEAHTATEAPKQDGSGNGHGDGNGNGDSDSDSWVEPVDDSDDDWEPEWLANSVIL